MPLAPLQLPLDGLPNEVGSLLALRQGGVDALKRPLGEAGRHLLVVDLFSSHAHKINDINYVDKSEIPDIIYSSERETDMANIKFFADLADGTSLEFSKVDYRSRKDIRGWTGSEWVKVTREVEYKQNASRHVCDDRCVNASGRIMKCECSCGGKNHGKGGGFKAEAA
jgi:hypothetical protein